VGADGDTELFSVHPPDPKDALAGVLQVRIPGLCLGLEVEQDASPVALPEKPDGIPENVRRIPVRRPSPELLPE
jgi:hypothetical protein